MKNLKTEFHIKNGFNHEANGYAQWFADNLVNKIVALTETPSVYLKNPDSIFTILHIEYNLN